jgi:EF hand
MSLNLNANYNFHHGGCIRPLPWRPQPIDGRGCDWLNRGRDHHRNLPDQNVGNWWNRCPFGPKNNNGYVIDLNNNGRYDRGRDGVLVFDTNRDGKYDQRDVSNTNDMMKAAAGNYDFNNDGRVSCCERRRGMFLRQRFARLDQNRDGRLDTREISQGGGKVWIDKSRGGGISQDELHSPYNLPGRWFGEGSRRLDSVDPRWGSQTSRNFPWWNRPRIGIRPRPFPQPFPTPFFAQGGRCGY